MAGNTPLSVTLSLVDKATAPLRAFGKGVKSAFDPIRKIKNQIKLTAADLGFNQVGKSLGGLKKSCGGVIKEVRAIGKEMAIVGGIAAGFVGGIVYSTANAGDAAIKTAQKVGVTTKAWTQLAYAADMSGISAESLKSGLTRLNKSVTDAANGSKQASQIFHDLGVSLHDQNGHLKTADDVMGEVAEKLAAMPDGAAKSRVAMELFGRSAGPDLIPLLNTGKDGIQAMREEAERLGVTISDGQGKSAEDFNDSFARIKYAIKGVTYAIGNQLIPVFSPLFKKIEALVTANRELIATKVGEWIDRIKAAWPEFEAGLKNVWATVKSLWASVDSLVLSLGGWSEVLPYLVAGLAVIKLAPLIASVYGLVTAVGALGVALLTTPVGWVVLAVAGLALGIRYLYKNCEGFRKFWNAMWDEVKSYVVGAVGRIREAFDKGLVQGILTILAEFNPKRLFIRAMAAVGRYFATLDLGVGGLVKRLLSAFLRFHPVTIFAKAFAQVWSYLSTLPVLTYGKAIITGLLDGIKAGWDAVTSWFSGIGSFFADAFSDFSLFDVGANILNSLWDGLKSIWAGLEEWFGNLSEMISGLIPESLTGLVGSVSGIASDAVKSVGGMAKSVGGMARSAGSTVAGWFGSGEKALGPAIMTRPEEAQPRDPATPRETYVTVEFKNVPRNVNVSATNVDRLIQSSFSDQMYNGAMGVTS